MSKRAIFISYSWDNNEHKAWVKKFRDDLQARLGDEFEVLLDRYLPKGFPLTRFMEIGLEKSERVLVIGTPAYKNKSISGKGVAFEHTIISSEMLELIDTTKFYPILRKGSFAESFPLALRSRVGDDFTDDICYEDNLQIVVNAIINDNPIPDIFKQDSTLVTAEKGIEQQKGRNQKIKEKPAKVAKRSIAALNGVVFSEDNTNLIFVPKDIIGSYFIPNGVTSISDFVFKDCTSLTSIELPNSVTEIGSGAFSGCTSLTSIEIPSSVTKVSMYAFSNCTSLSSIVIPNSVTVIGESAFYGCTRLISIEIPSSVTVIGRYAFDRCYCLKKIVVDEKNSNFCSKDGVLYSKDMSRLIAVPGGIKSILIPYSVTEIVWQAFSNCMSIKEIIVDKKNPYYSSKDRILYSKDMSRLIAVTGDIKSIVIPNGVTHIGIFAFAGCQNLTSIEMPNSVTEIEDYAFFFCSNLTSIKIPYSVTVIRARAFECCTNLTSIEIPESVTKICNGVFYGCSNLVEFHLRHTEPIDISDSLEDLDLSKITLYIPKWAEFNYRNHPLYCQFGKIEAE